MAILLLNKPAGMTSHDVVDAVRAKTGERRVGHSGTLDPFADGLLIVMVGKDDTKRQSEFLHLPKAYEAIMVLGAESDTDDLTGVIRESPTGAKPTWDEIERAFSTFRGVITQVPPAYSAIKLRGKKAYELARVGVQPHMKPRRVTVHELSLLSYEWPRVTFRAYVASGTYIRALARDIGRALGTGAYLSALTRTSIGPYKLSAAQTLEQFRAA
jgi:tRNA pseudouridine55 synthase